MKIFDVHIHMYAEGLDADAFLKQLDEAGVYGACVYSAPPIEESPLRGLDYERRLQQILDFVKGNEDRLIPVLRIHPNEENLAEKVKLACESGIAAFKFICTDYYPYEDKCINACREVAKYGKPVIFHSGVLYSDKMNVCDFNRPMNFEKLFEVEGLRFALAHCSWPWTDECIALYGRFNYYSKVYADKEKKPAEMFIDLTPGTPPIYREELLTKLFKFSQCTADNLLFGTDAVVDRYPVNDVRKLIERDTKCTEKLGVSKENITKYFHDNLMRFLGVEGYETEVRTWGWKYYNPDVNTIIEKWYKKLEFPKEYDREFYSALKEYTISDNISIDTYDLDCKDGKRNLLSFLFMCEELSQKYAEKGIPQEIMVHTAKDLVLWTNAWSDVKNEMYLGELNWLCRHFKMKLFRLGNLEYVIKESPFDFAQYGIKKGDTLIDVHIPNDAKFATELCDESFRYAKKFFSEYYPEYKLDFFTCASWLLDRELDKLLPETSNIIKFGRRFTVVDEKTHESFGALRYVFKWNTNRLNLKNAVCTSGFSERLKKFVMDGNSLYSVTGVFSVNDI